MKKYLAIIFKILLTTLFITLGSYLLREAVGKDLLVAENSGFGWYVGIMGTLYTLFAAFIIITVWGQFTTTSSQINKEAKLLTSIWNFTDYLNDKGITKKMRSAIVVYIEKVLNHEQLQLAKQERTVHPSPELLVIFKVIDQVNFDDQRDLAVYPSLIKAYENLSTIRSERIESGLTRVPFFIKFLFIVLNLNLLIANSLVGYINLGIFLFSIITCTLVIVTAYFVVLDLDNPFSGTWNIDYSPLEQAKKYILSA